MMMPLQEEVAQRLESDYIQNGSSKVEFTDPTIGTYSKNVQGEDNYAWTGNAPWKSIFLNVKSSNC